jgi:hypothetical protein
MSLAHTQVECWSFADKTDFGVALLCVAALAFVAGLGIGADREALKPKPAPEVVYRAPLMQFQCTKREIAEHIQACKDRRRSM